MLNSLHYLKYRIGISPAITQTTAAERSALRHYAEGKERLAEIGVFHGVNTRAFREVMSPEGVILAIDPFERSLFGLRGYGWARRIAHAEVNKVKNGKVFWIETYGLVAPQSEIVASHLPVDFLFIDGDHSYEGLEGDWEAWKNHISLGGILALHDSRNRDGCGSERFTSEVILQDAEWAVEEVVDSLTVLRKRAQISD